MNLYKLSQSDVRGYDTYDLCVVAAESEDEARNMHPDGSLLDGPPIWGQFHSGDTWTKHPVLVEVELIGVAAPGIKAGVIIASFHAG